ncbi:MAG: MBL fold metallo-hydrolase, partial [Lachnospiraceae bacterium]|nr:MBL fold metallo-hydrolase [Lachnospiraceae bacterium]
GRFEDDYNMDDTALVYKGDHGIFVITGCSHSGICNIVDYAKYVCDEERVTGVLGGFHLFADDEQLKKTISYLESCKIDQLYPCHCVSLLARARMMERLPVVETGVGMVIEIDE